jgi:hypothetical protein
MSGPVQAPRTQQWEHRKFLSSKRTCSLVGEIDIDQTHKYNCHFDCGFEEMSFKLSPERLVSCPRWVSWPGKVRHPFPHTITIKKKKKTESYQRKNSPVRIRKAGNMVKFTEGQWEVMNLEESLTALVRSTV